MMDEQCLVKNFFLNENKNNLLRGIIIFLQTDEKLRLNSVNKNLRNVLSKYFIKNEIVVIKNYIFDQLSKLSSMKMFKLKPEFLIKMIKELEKINKKELQDFSLKIIMKNFKILFKRIRIEASKNPSYYECLNRLSLSNNDTEIIRISCCEVFDYMLNSLSSFMNNTNSIKTVELFSTVFNNGSFETVSKLISVNKNLTSLFLDKISFGEDSFNFFVHSVNLNKSIKNLSLKRISFNFKSDLVLEKLINENFNVKNFEFSLNILNHQTAKFIYSNILNCIGNNRTIEHFDLEDYKIEIEDINKVEKFYEVREHLASKTILIDYNLDNINLMKIFEIYLKYKPNLYLSLVQNGFILIYDKGIPKVEMTDFSIFKNDMAIFYEQFILKYEIKTLLFNLEDYFGMTNFLKFLKEKDPFKNIIIKYINASFFDYLGEFLHITKKEKTVEVNSLQQVPLIRFNNAVILSLLNNTSTKINLIVKSITCKIYHKILDYIEEKRKDLYIASFRNVRFTDERNCSIHLEEENSFRKINIKFIK